MAEPELSTFFPVPPPFYKAFTKANQDQLQQLQTATSEEASNQEGISQRLLELPPEVRLLIPPKPPSDGIHQSFGAELGGPEKTLTELGAEQLVPSPPQQSNSTSSDPTGAAATPWTQSRAQHLKKITQSIMLNFLELLGTLSVHPQHAHDKVADLEILFLNAHNLVNELRPHQARAELIWNLEKRLEGLEAEIEGVHEMRRKTGDLLAALRSEGARTNESSAADDEPSYDGGMKARRVQEASMRALDAELLV